MARPVLWNRLGSAAQVADSAIGLDADYLGGGSFAAGRFGGAYFAGPDADARLLVPKLGVINPEAGAIEFWGRISGFPEVIDWGARPNFLSDQGTQSRAYWTAGFGFNGNNGLGGGGLAADVSGNGAATGSFADPWTYDGILADDPDGWHHYALVWNAEGIAVGGGHIVDIYLDGQRAAHQWDVDQPGALDAVTVEDSFLGLLDNWGGQGTAAIDNLKIWNFSKTDYADRFVEGLTLVGDSRANRLIGTDSGDDLAGCRGDDTLNGLGGGDRLAGGDGDDRIFGGRGGDVAAGGRGNDLVRGDDGNDAVRGGAGADTLGGGAGADRIADGAGLDRLSGGAGADVFVFALDGRTDRIADFGPGDVIDVAAWHTDYAGLAFETRTGGAIFVASDDDALLLSGPGLVVGDLTPDRFVFDLA
jgi:Ca2+-binding RTX toxin-like protein